MRNRPHQLSDDQTLRKLGNFKKILEILELDGEYPAAHPKAKKHGMPQEDLFCLIPEFVPNPLSKTVAISQLTDRQL